MVKGHVTAHKILRGKLVANIMIFGQSNTEQE